MLCCGDFLLSLVFKVLVAQTKKRRRKDKGNGESFGISH
jgi:hypothetical protein